MQPEINNNLTRQQKIEQFLLDPDKTIFNTLEEFEVAVKKLTDLLANVDIDSLEQLKGIDGVTPVRGQDYFTEEDIAGIEAFINSKIPTVGVDLPSVQQVESFIAAEVAKIPRIKGDPGDRGLPGIKGKDGSPDQPIDVIKKIRSLRNTNQGLQISDVRGLQNALKVLVTDDEFQALVERFDNQKIVFPASSGGEGNDTVAIHSDGVDEFDVIPTEANPAAGDFFIAERASDGTKIKVAFSDIAGTPGVDGDDGADGVDGKTVLSGIVDPTTEGVNGDFYINFDTWQVFGPKAAGVWPAGVDMLGEDGAGSGDMQASTYDPNNVADDAFDMENMVEGATKKILTAAERTKLGHISVTQAVDLDAIETQAAAGSAAKVKTDFITVTQAVDLDAIETQAAAGAAAKVKTDFMAVTQAVDLDTMETQAAAGAAAKVKTDFITVTQAVDLDTIETQAAAGAAAKVKTDHLTVTQAVDLDAIETRVNALDAAVILKGTWDASAGTFPGGGTAQAGESWIVSVTGTVDGVTFTAGDRIIAIVDNASTGTFAANWFKADYTDLFTSQTLGDLINASSAKATPVDADMLPVMDSAASNIAKKLSWANLKATIKTYFDTLYQPVDADLTTIAGLTATTNNFIVAVASAWASRTPAQVKTTLSLDNVDNTSNATERAAAATLTNKNLTSTTNTFATVTTTASSATPTPTGDSRENEMYITALSAAAAFAAPSGTPTNGNKLFIRVKDNGTARALTYNAIYRASSDLALPATTVVNKTLYMAFRYNSADSKWDLLAVLNNFT